MRLVTAAETNDARRLNESRVKVATGSDPITARYLYKENFTYIPQFKIWLAMNHKPTIKGTDDGIWINTNFDNIDVRNARESRLVSVLGRKHHAHELYLAVGSHSSYILHIAT